MPYTVPTIVQLKAYYPEFATTPDPQLTAALTDASRKVGTDWFEPDYQPAIIHLAAHYLTVAESSAAGGGFGGLISESVGLGPISVSYTRSKAAAENSAFATTGYGMRYLEILRANVPAIGVV